MESINISDRQGNEICEKVSKTLVDELDNEKVWNKVEGVLSDYLKNNNIKEDTSDFIDKLEWSVRVTLKK
ncbi:MAG: hypothetical protein FWG55_08155 [Candidatus Bathyarchaeota archaeon]|nr:hypothetical protein [Candidatus Termiticorpusculum sp.]